MLAAWFAAELFSKKMQYARMQEQESRFSWLAGQMRCCASKEDVVDEGREALSAHGTFYISASLSFLSSIHLIFSSILSSRLPFPSVFDVPSLSLSVEMHDVARLSSP